MRVSLQLKKRSRMIMIKRLIRRSMTSFLEFQRRREDSSQEQSLSNSALRDLKVFWMTILTIPQLFKLNRLIKKQLQLKRLQPPRHQQKRPQLPKLLPQQKKPQPHQLPQLRKPYPPQLRKLLLQLKLMQLDFLLNSLLLLRMLLMMMFKEPSSSSPLFKPRWTLI